MTSRLRPLASSDGVLWLVFLALSLIKMRGYALHGRFWAEEGPYFFPDIAGLSGVDGLFYVFNGHIELLTNMVIWSAAQVNFHQAPLVTTWGSWLLQCLPVALVIHFRADLGLTFARTLIFVVAVCGLPQSAEVWANSINLHFHFALLAGIIAVLPLNGARQTWCFRGLLLMAGLSGIPANSLLPIFFLLAFWRKEREKWVQTGILGFTTLLQLGLIAFHGIDTTKRAPTTDPAVFWLALTAQHWLSPLLGKKLGGDLIPEMNLLQQSDALAWGLSIAATLLYLAIIGRMWRERATVALACMGTGLFLAAFCVLTSLGDRQALVSVSIGGRYFFAPNLLLVIGLLIWLPAGRLTRIALFVWTLILLSGVRAYIPGPPWQDAYETARQNRSATIEIWPKGWHTPNATH